MNAAVSMIDAFKSFWEPFRQSMLRSLGAAGHAQMADRGLPVVVYIDRQVRLSAEAAADVQREGHSKLSEDDHKSLVEGLKRLTPLAEVHVTKLTTMSKVQQIELMLRAEVSQARGDELMPDRHQLPRG